MFFTRLGKVLAWLALVFGSFRIAGGIALASVDNIELAKRYLGSSSTGEAIDQGLMLVVLGIAMGIAAEISRSLHYPLGTK